MARTRITARRAVRLSGSTLPTAFRLFERDWNATTHGDFLFDEEAAESVMRAYREHGVDLAIDLEHQMLDDEPSPDPTAKDARGWCRLELRTDGSLWAVDVRWTPDGAARLTEKRQRYVSPAFYVDSTTSRITEIVNVAITATPATHHTPALVAANKKRRSEMTKRNPLRARRVTLAVSAQTTIEKIGALLGLEGVAIYDEPLVLEKIRELFEEASAAGEGALEVAARRTGLTAREIAMCRAKRISLREYAARRAARGALRRPA